MTDIDFDELDRAVNSFISEKSGNNNATVEQSVAAPSNSNPPLVAISDSVPVKPSAGSPASLAGRRTGQFMDVVRSSSNVRNTQPATTVAMPVSRQGATLEPISKEPIVSDTKPTEQVSVEPQTQNMTSNSVNPVELMNNQQAVNIPKPQLNKEEDSDNNKISDGMNVEPSQQSGLPDTPFLSGAKVEKRPLGAFSGGAPDQTQSADSELSVNQESTLAVSQEEEMLEPKPAVYMPSKDKGESSVNMNVPLPEELRDELLSIESDSTTSPDVGVAAKPDEIGKPSVNQPSGVAAANVQNRKESDTDSQKSGAIYDTDNYHKALIHPTKKKSGWLWVLWIVLLLVLGAGAGAAVYLLVSPNL